MDAREEQRSLALDPLPPESVVKQDDVFAGLPTLPPLTRALECETRMAKVQEQIDQLTKQYIAGLAGQVQELVSIRQEAIQEAVNAQIEADDRAVLMKKTRSSKRIILAKVLKEKDQKLYDAVIAAQRKALDQEKAALKEQKEVPLGVTEKVFKEVHGKGFDEAGIFEPVTITIDYAVISVEAKRIQEQIEASKKAKKKELST
jgi:hypothetical protein